MDWNLVIGVIVVVLVGGSIVALVWWNIAARVAPYEDELDRQERDKARRVDEVVIRLSGGGSDAESGGGKTGR